MRCRTSPAPFQCGRSKATTSTPGNALFERRDRGLGRPVADADEQRPLVEPDRVAALDERGCRDARRDRDACGLERRPRAQPARRAAPPCPGAAARRPRARRGPGRRRRSRPGSRGRGARRRPRRRPPRGAPQSASCSAAAAARSGAARQPYVPPVRGVLRERWTDEHALERPGHRRASEAVPRARDGCRLRTRARCARGVDVLAQDQPVLEREDVDAVPLEAAARRGPSRVAVHSLTTSPSRTYSRRPRNARSGQFSKMPRDVRADLVALDALTGRVVLEHHARRVQREDRVDVVGVPGGVVALDRCRSSSAAASRGFTAASIAASRH